MPNFFQRKHIAKRFSKFQNVWYFNILVKKILDLEGEWKRLKNALICFLKASSQTFELGFLSCNQICVISVECCFHFLTMTPFSNKGERYDHDKRNSQYESIKEALELIQLWKSSNLEEKFPSDFVSWVSNFFKLRLLITEACMKVLSRSPYDLCKIRFMFAL